MKTVAQESAHEHLFQASGYPQFHYLEFPSQSDELEFDDDLIASTHEINYTHSKFKANLKMQ